MSEDYRRFIFSGDVTKALDLSGLFGESQRIEVDIGSGMGRFLLAKAKAHPERQFIAIERLKPRVEKIAKKAHRQGIGNIFLVRLEALYVLRYLLPPESISRFYLFFPDPWPKRRHSGHRIFNAEFRSLVFSRLKSGGELQVATDSAGYFSDMLSQMKDDLRFERIPPVARGEDQFTDFELIFTGQGIKTNASGFRARSRDEIGAEALERYALEDEKRQADFWNEEMPHGKSVHITGICGVGMSAIAQGYLDRGFEVTGSDRLLDSGGGRETAGILARQGARLFPQDGSGISEATGAVVVSSAIEKDNPDLASAQAQSVGIIHRSEALEELVGGKKLIAVAGTAGKSTVTALVGSVLAHAGLDPMVVNGASCPLWSADGSRIGSVRKGDGEWAVIEADESDGSFLRFLPDMGIVTNETPDHFGEEKTKELFAAFKRNVAGTLIDGLPESFEPLPSEGWKSRFRYLGEEYCVSLPGVHNAQNACHALAAGLALGIDRRVIKRALMTFPGIDRRFMRVGNTASGTAVIDDYAHNPEKLAAAMSAARKLFGSFAILWRPHGFAPLKKMSQALAGAFAEGLGKDCELVLLPVYDAGGTADRSFNVEVLSEPLASRGVRFAVAGDVEEAERLLLDYSGRTGGKGAIIVSGARDPALPLLAKRLARGA